MNRPSFLLYVMASLVLGPAAALAANTITMTTYYPSPTGNYDKLQANDLKVIGSRSGYGTVGDSGCGGDYTGLALNGQVMNGCAANVANYNILSSPSDPQLYLNRPPGATMRFREGNVDQMIIASGGNIGIGVDPGAAPAAGLTINKTNGGLYVQRTETWLDYNATAGNYLGGTTYFRKSVDPYDVNALIDGTGAADTYFAAVGGQVGIGMTTPTANLYVAGGSYGSVGSANQAAYALGAQSIASDSSIYSYVSICAQNANGDCTGAGGVVLGATNSSANVNIPVSADIIFNNGHSVGIGVTDPTSSLYVAGGGYGAVGNANQAAYALGAQSIASASSIYSYDSICAQNASGDCTGAGGVVLGRTNASANVNIPVSADIIFNNGHNVGIGNTGPSYPLDVTGDARITGVLGTGGKDPSTGLPGGWGGGLHTWDVFAEGSVGVGPAGTANVVLSNNGNGTFAGDISVAGKVTAGGGYFYSDERLKQNIHPLEGALDKIQQLNGVNFEWKKTGAKDIGVIAQNVEKVLPELVITGNDGMKSVAYGNLTAVLIEAVKEQQAEIGELKKQVAELQQRKM